MSNDGAAPEAAPGAPGASAAPADKTKGVVTGTGGTVTLQLDPEHLGRVSVTLRVHADTVNVRIEVEQNRPSDRVETAASY